MSKCTIAVDAERCLTFHCEIKIASDDLLKQHKGLIVKFELKVYI